MGAGASVNEYQTLANEQLINNFVEMYSKDPGKWDYVISEGTRRYREQQQQHQQQQQNNNVVKPYRIALPEHAAAATSSSFSPSVASKLELFSEQLVVSINLARRNPLVFITDYLEPHLARFVDERVYEEEVTVVEIATESNNGQQGAQGTTKVVKRRIETKEGRAAVVEAVQYMKAVPPGQLPLLQSSVLLAAAAADHCRDIGATGSTEHSGSDGSQARDRVSRHCVWSRCLGENIDFGNTKPADIVMALIVDDGVAGRGHRKNIFAPDYAYVGGCLGRHKIYDVCCVMDFAGGVKALDSVVREDTQVTNNQGVMTDEFRKVLMSIPSSNADGSQTELVGQMEEWIVKKKAEVTLSFEPSKSKATIRIKDGSRINTMNIGWATE